MKLVFCGTPQFAVPTLEAVIAAGHDVALVVTQPDRAAGRGMEVQPSPVKRAAMRHDIPVVQPEKIKNNAEFRQQLEDVRPDAILVVAYGRIIPQWMLDLPKHGNINLHGSLLPKYRGAAPLQWAIANGESVTGVTTMRLDAGLDTGDMLLAKAVPVGQEETAIDVYEDLAAVGAELMVETLCGLAEGSLFCQPQDHSLATLAPILTREDGRIDFTRTAQNIYDRWRGFQPWPGAHTMLRGKKLIVHKMHIAQHSSHGEPGTLAVEGDVLMAFCVANTALVFDEVQIEGKRRMSAAEFLRGYQVKTGERLGQ
ncbi:MAG TPA: methionyl-tRNA formyltransferase [Edaphobacter sp.]|nr:methionyl-tRNA formyltransferase [Edaphobacter sp.]